jgi:phospholipase/carboxylesterase
MLPPASGDLPKQLVVLLHGYGADGADLIDLGRAFAPVLPDALFVAPNAPEPCGTGPYGFQWFPLDVERIGASLDGVPDAAPVVRSYLAELWQQTGLRPADTFLVGFSQGAMVALHVGLSMPEPLRGIVAFSGALIPPDGLEQGQWPKPPVALAHGDLDSIVDPGQSRTAAGTLAGLGYDVSYHRSPATGHGISPNMLAFAADFLRTRDA